MRTWIRTALSRIAALLHRRRQDDDFREELDAHLTMREADLLRRGLTPGDARRQARVDLGSMSGLREAHRDLRGLPFADVIGLDVRAAVRSLRRDASLTFAGVLIIGLGVGACATVFSVFNTLFLRPLPFADPARLVWIANGDSDNLSEQTTQVSNLLELGTQARAFTGLAGFSPFYGVGDVRLTSGGAAERLTEVPVTETFFPLLGVRPLHGRLFTPDECLWNAPKVVLLDHGFWRRRLAGDPSVVGTTIALDATTATIVGVLPPTFDFASTFAPGSRGDVFTPYPLTDENNRRGNTLALVGRLAEGVTAQAAQAEAVGLAARFLTGRQSGVWRNALVPRVTPLQQKIAGQFRDALLVLGGAVGFLLVLISANVASLLLAKGAARRREMAVRTALGAGRKQLIRQGLVQHALLTAAGAALGLALAFAGISIVAGLDGTAIPLLRDVRLDATTLGFTTLVVLGLGLAVGVLPAWQMARTMPQALNDGSRGGTTPVGPLRRALVVAEVATVCVMLTGGGLLARSLVNVLRVEPGFDTAGLTIVRVDPGPAFRSLARRTPYFTDMVRAVEALPDVEAAGITDALPFGHNFGWRRWGASAPERPQTNVEPLVRMVDPGYFAAMRIRVVSGRPFVGADDASGEPVVIVNDALSRALWPNEAAVGRTLRTAGVARRVIGVVAEARYFSLERPSGPEMYMPVQQTGDFRVVTLVVRSGQPADALAPALRASLARVDPALPIGEIRAMDQLVDDTVFARRSVSLLVLGFAAFGLVLASVGLYAVIAYSVHQRRPEIGIRMALGAAPRTVQARVLAETLRLVVAGVAIGLPLAWAVSRALRGLLFGVQPADPATLALVLGVLVLVAGVAGYVPARRAARVDPVEVLRSA